MAATEPITSKRTGSPNASESDNSLNANLNSKPEAEEPVAISKLTSSELSETNDKISDICDNSRDDKSLVISTNINSSNNVSISNIGIKTDSKQLNKSSAQHSVKSVSQVSTESVATKTEDEPRQEPKREQQQQPEEINENGDIGDSCNESLEEKETTPEIGSYLRLFCLVLS